MFKGVYTALVTPFKKDGSIDTEALKSLVEFQIKNGIDGLVPCGSTGESATLNYEEHDRVIELVIEYSAGRVPVIAGTGSNSTKEAIEMTRHAKEAGATATLQVVPYYNKPNQEGLYRHFSEIADIGLPVVLYNIPGRCGCELDVSTVVRLSKHPNICAIKEASGNIERVSMILDACNITVLSGDDSLILPMMSIGAKGVISVASNIVPKEVSQMVKAALDGNYISATAIHKKYFKLFKVLFIDTNPIPIKAALAMKGMIENTCRSPLCELDENKKKILRNVLESMEII